MCLSQKLLHRKKPILRKMIIEEIREAPAGRSSPLTSQKEYPLKRVAGRTMY